jgi:hypothetical protein
LALSLLEDFPRMLSFLFFEFTQANPAKSAKGQCQPNISFQSFPAGKNFPKPSLKIVGYKLLDRIRARRETARRIGRSPDKQSDMAQ